MILRPTTSRRAGTNEDGTRRGMAAVEFALLLPLIFTLVMGMIETGNMFLTWLSIQEAAEVGARFASTGQGEDDGTRLTQIADVSANVLGSLNGDTKVLIRCYPGRDVSASAVENSAGTPCDMVEVEVRHDYSPVTPIIGSLLPDTITLSSSDRKVNEPWEPCSGT